MTEFQSPAEWRQDKDREEFGEYIAAAIRAFPKRPSAGRSRAITRSADQARAAAATRLKEKGHSREEVLGFLHSQLDIIRPRPPLEFDRVDLEQPGRGRYAKSSVWDAWVERYFGLVGGGTPTREANRRLRAALDRSARGEQESDPAFAGLPRLVGKNGKAVGRSTMLRHLSGWRSLREALD